MACTVYLGHAAFGHTLMLTHCMHITQTGSKQLMCVHRRRNGVGKDSGVGCPYLEPPCPSFGWHHHCRWAACLQVKNCSCFITGTHHLSTSYLSYQLTLWLSSTLDCHALQQHLCKLSRSFINTLNCDALVIRILCCNVGQHWWYAR